MWTGSVIFFACLLQLSIQRSTPQDNSYVAAVVEYREVRVNVEPNVQNYMQHIAEAAKENADIVVFPEGTLTGSLRAVSVPINGLLKEYPIPALRPDLYDEILVSMSSAARENEVYVVVNINEMMDCFISTGEECPEERVYLFNTNVVFDRTGAVIDRYRKINLYRELHRPPAPELGIFTTDFGVTFGHFMSFDLMFQVPAMQVVEKYNLTDVIFTTSFMFAEMPYLTGVQVQQAYAYAMNINFLASGANNPLNGFVGSGIYSGKAGALISIMPSEPGTRLLVSRVPKTPGQLDFSVPGPIYEDPSVLDRLDFTSDNSRIAHTSRALVPGFQEFTLVDKDVSCKFTVRLRQRVGITLQSYTYRATVFDGVRDFSRVTTLGNRVCSVLACSAEDDITACGSRFFTYEANTTAVFEELIIEATVPTPVIVPELEAYDSAYFPVSLNVNLMPLKSSDFAYTIKEEGKNITHTFKLINSDAELYTFAVWGRKFERDGQEASGPPEPSGSSFVHVLCPWLLAAATVTIFSSNRLF